MIRNRIKINGRFLTGVLLGIALGAVVAFKKGIEEVIKWKKLSDKHLNLFLIMNQWIRKKQEGKNLSEYLLNHNFKLIAVYGMSYMGQRVVDELKKSEVKIVYGIDKNADKTYEDIKIVTLDNLKNDVDVVVVTAIAFMDEIERNLSSKLSCPIISLEDIIWDL